MNTANNQNSEHSAEVSLEQIFRSEVVRKLGEISSSKGIGKSHKICYYTIF